jgi:hypothetical protein
MAELTEDAAASAPSWLQLESIIPLGGSDEVTAAKITDLSPDTLKLTYPELIVRTSARRVGMKLKHALDIATPK